MWFWDWRRRFGNTRRRFANARRRRTFFVVRRRRTFYNKALGIYGTGPNPAKKAYNGAAPTLSDRQIQLAVKFIADDRAARSASFCRRWRKQMGHYTKWHGIFPEIKDNPCPNDGFKYDQPRAALGTCYRRCVPGMVTCGREACAADSKSCVDKVFGFILGPISVGANLLTAGAASKVATAIKVTKTAVSAVGDAANAYTVGSIMAQQIQGFMDSSCKVGSKEFISIASSQASSATWHHFDTATDEFGKQPSWNARHANYYTICRAYAKMFLVSEMKASNIAMNDLALSMIDPTGLVGLVQGYMMADCLDPPKWSSIQTEYGKAVGAVKGLAAVYPVGKPKGWRPPQKKTSCRRRAFNCRRRSRRLRRRRRRI